LRRLFLDSLDVGDDLQNLAGAYFEDFAGPHLWRHQRAVHEPAMQLHRSLGIAEHIVEQHQG
jgi:hypothetical protein